MNAEIKERIEQVRRGEVPEGYRHTKGIGITPVGWPLGKMEDVLHNEQRPVSKPGKAYWRLRLRSHAKGTFHELVEDPDTISMDELYEVKKDDLVVSITFAWEHAIALAGKEDEGMLVSHRFPTYVFNDGNSPQFYKAIVTQRQFKSMLENISPGGAGRNRVMSKSAFLKLAIPIPPIHKQGKIAEMLTHCDKVIDLKKQLIEEKRRRKKWLMQKLLNPDSGIRLPGFEGSEWICGTLKNLVKIRHGQNQSTVEVENGKYPILASGGEIGRTNEFLCDKPSVLIGRKGSIDKPLYMESPFWTVDTLFYTDIKESIFPKFVYYLFESINWWKYNQSTGVPSLSASTIESIEALFPLVINEQIAIASILSATDRELDLLEQELTQWQLKKKSLTQLLLSGIVRV